MSFRKGLAALAPWVLLAIIILAVAALQLSHFDLPQRPESQAPLQDAPHAIDSHLTLSLREFLNSSPTGSIVILCTNGRPSRQTWNELSSGMIRVGAQREISPVRGASFILVGAMGARLGSAVSKMGVQEVEVELDEGQPIGSTGVLAPCRIVAKSIGDAEGVGRAIISVGGVQRSPNEPGVNVVVIDKDGRCVSRASFR